MTAHELRIGNRSRAKIATFIVFAVATYYLQMMYMIAHVPEVALGAGVSETHRGLITTLRDASIYIIPLLLPLSTLLYTVSHQQSQESHIIQKAQAIQVKKADGEQKLLAQNVYKTPKGWAARSPLGHVLRDDYDSEARAHAALKLHLRAKSVQAQLPAKTGESNEPHHNGHRVP